MNNKFALKQGGWNTVDPDTKLKDHTMRDIRDLEALEKKYGSIIEDYFSEGLGIDADQQKALRKLYFGKV